MTSQIASPDQARILPVRRRWALLAAALVLGLSGRIAYSHNAPLWFDETYSGVIASQATLVGLLEWCLHELTGPAYYLPLWLWEKVAGHGDFALRLPSLVLSLATPFAILRFGHRDANLRFWWTVVVLLWVPFLPVAGEARAYPEIFALGVAQTALFVRLLTCPTLKRASLWVIVSSLLVLCNYWGAIPSGVQGIAFLLVHRARAARLWPALFFLMPMLTWAWFHLPFVLGLTIGGSSGIDGMPLSDLFRVPAMLMGVGFTATVVLAVVAGSVAWTTASGRRPAWPLSAELVLALCGLASILAILVIAFVRPGFAPRYAMAAMPSFLFGLALWIRWMAKWDWRPVIVVLAMLFTTTAGIVLPILIGPDKDPRHIFELERPSAWLAAAPQPLAGQLVVFWDGPIARSVPDFTIREVGGFFLRREGHAVEVSVARMPPTGNPNLGILALAREKNAAVLWFANDQLPGERAPRLERYDARLECRNFGGGEVTMTACRWRRQ